MLDEEDMLKLINAYEVVDKLQKIIQILTDSNESFGTGCFKSLTELQEVIIKHSAPEMKKSVRGLEPLGDFILFSDMVPEAKVDYLVGKRFLKENEE